MSETAQARKSAVYMAMAPAFILVVYYFVDPDEHDAVVHRDRRADVAGHRRGVQRGGLLLGPRDSESGYLRSSPSCLRIRDLSPT